MNTTLVRVCRSVEGTEMWTLKARRRIAQEGMRNTSGAALLAGSLCGLVAWSPWRGGVVPAVWESKTFYL